MVVRGLLDLEWTGVPLRSLLEEAGPLPGAIEVLFTGRDHGIEDRIAQHFERSLSVAEASRPEVLLAYGMNGAPLPSRHGFPLRLIMPGWYGMASVKWLERMTVLTEPHTGYMQTSYTIQEREEDVGRVVTRIAPRSLMVRPGLLDDDGVWMIETYQLDLHGRAWSGWAPIDRVEVSLDGGATWRDAALDAPIAPYAWIAWRFEATFPGPGGYILCSRATDAAGHTQPTEELWNLGGFANNAVERVPVTLVPPNF